MDRYNFGAVAELEPSQRGRKRGVGNDEDEAKVRIAEGGHEEMTCVLTPFRLT